MHVATMGKLRVVGADGPRQQQPLALLCYLALSGPKTRDHLAAVFWPEAKRPLNNLSSALTRIRGHLPDVLRVEANVGICSLESDAAELQQAISCVDVKTILDLYQGHFLEATSLRMGLELEEWVFGMRETLAISASAALLAAADQRPSIEGAALGEQAYRIGGDFWIEQAAWQRCYELVVDDVSLAARVRVDAARVGITVVSCDESVGAPAAQTTVASSSSSNELFGRSEELAALSAFRVASLDEDSSNWLAIVGMGGVGKTALATTWLELLRLQPGTTTHLVELADLHHVDQLPESVASALGLPYTGEGAFLEALQMRCSVEQPLVVVLDNLEQLSDYAPFLRQFAAIDGLTVVVTTRVLLGDDHEHSLQLRGLVDERSSAAQAMFIAKALPLCPDIAEHPEAIEQACELLGGHPLAIELFTSWLRTVPLHVALDSLVKSDELVSQTPHGSLEPMESLLDRSWKLLDTNQARVLGKLALFEGPFGYDDAIATTGTSLAILSQLVTSSLLARRDDELVLHPLIRSYALAKLCGADPLAADEAERAYVAHFRQRMIDAASALRGPDAGKASPELAAAFVNVQAAWKLALIRQNWQAIGDMADGMAIHLKSQSRLFLSSQLFGDALDQLSEVADPQSRQPAMVLVAVGWRYAMTRLVQGDRAGALETVERCTLLCHPRDRIGQMGLSHMRGQIDSFAGRYAEAALHFAHARSLADDTTQEWFVAEIETGSAIVALALEDVDEARRLTRSVLETGRRLENPVIISDAYYCLGSLEFEDDPAGALVLLNEASEVAEAAALTQMSRKYAAVIGRCHIALDDPQAAIVVFERALAETLDGDLVHEPWVRIVNQSGLATALSLTGDHRRATALFTETVRGAVQLDDWPLMLEIALEICRFRSNRSSLPAWHELLDVVASHEATMWHAEAVALVELAGNPPVGGTTPIDDMSLGVVAERALLVLQG